MFILIYIYIHNNVYVDIDIYICIFAEPTSAIYIYGECINNMYT